MSNEQLTWSNFHRQDKPGLAWRTKTNPAQVQIKAKRTQKRHENNPVTE
jgi:hypothetical protein